MCECVCVRVSVCMTFEWAMHTLFIFVFHAFHIFVLHTLFIYCVFQQQCSAHSRPAGTAE